MAWQRHPNIHLALDEGLQQLITAALQCVIGYEKERIDVKDASSVRLSGLE
jgi:hypothetical protein